MPSQDVEISFQKAQQQHQMGRLKEAERAYLKILDDEPGHAPSLHNLGLLNSQRGRLTQAIDAFRRALQVKPDYAEAYFNLANVLKMQGQLNKAVKAYRNALRLLPGDLQTLQSLAMTLIQARRMDEARDAFEAILRINSDDAQTHFNLGNLLLQLDDLEGAEAAYKKAVRLQPDFIQALNNLGLVQWRQGRGEDAERNFRQVLALQADYVEAHNNLGTVLLEQGRLTEAETSYRHALRINPSYCKSHRNLALCRNHYSLADDDVKAIESLLGSNKSVQDQIQLLLAMGKVFDDCGDYEQAFKSYHAANQMRHQTSRFRSDELRFFIDGIINVFDIEFYKHEKPVGSETQRPVFIVGLPRSGKSLVETILSHHPQIAGMGERRTLQNLIDKFPKEHSIQVDFPHSVNYINEAIASDLAQCYTTCKSSPIQNDIIRVCDSLPANFFYLGYINILFPNARIIHCVRNPWDNCLFIYFKNFAEGYFDYAYDLSDIGTYYTQYLRLLRHWRAVLPAKQIEVSYENLISDTEVQVGQLLQFLNVEQDKTCSVENLTQDKRLRSPYSSEGHMLHTHEIDHWRHYEEFLGSLQAKLKLESI